MKLKDIKATYDEYSDLIKTIAAVIVLLCTGIGIVSGLVIREMVSNTVATEVGQVQAVTDLNTSVATLTATVKAATISVERLDATVTTLQKDVTAIHKHLAGIE